MTKVLTENRIGSAFAVWLILSVIYTPVVQAQFIDLQLEVEPKITAETLRQLNFGPVVTNTGRRMIALGDVNMGVFSITALENQVLLFDVQTPRNLRHEDPGVTDRIGLDVYMRYGYQMENPEISGPLDNGITAVKIEDNGQAGPWSRIYLFIYGSIEIGNIQEGIYTNQIVLNVEYL
jgi:hypothetical protein